MDWSKLFSFTKRYLRDPRVAALSPSSKPVICRILKHLPLENISTLVELGPGDGVATKQILAGLKSDARVLAIETNAVFAADLQAWGDKRLKVVLDDARRLLPCLAENNISAPDAIIASIPFTYLSREERRELVADAKTALKPGGIMIIFHQYSPLMAPYLKEAFGKVNVEFEPLNIFPCFVMTAVKE
ncbi:MAG: rRNA adenine N-6-methyltransferase family protein [Patescibacteria group bacterium]|jgi:phospholipid N-methyltransferase